MNASFLRWIVAPCLLAAAQAHAATITIVDPAAAGFTDTTPVAPVAGNPGTTLGAQRLYVFQRAAQQWGAVLTSAVEIRVEASMSPDTCSGTSAVLGTAYPINVHSNFTNAPKPDTWYVSALANSLSGVDEGPASNDFTAVFNSDMDSGTCLNSTVGWWYGVDPSVTPPADRISLLGVLMHEFGHGLGFLSAVSPYTGMYCCSDQPLPDAWAWYMRDEYSGYTWTEMTDNERADSAINDPYLVWTGRNVNRMQAAYLSAAPVLKVNTPPAIAGDNPVQAAPFGGKVPKSGLTRNVVLADDGSTAGGGTINDACEPLTNAAQVAGKIALVERGVCYFVTKAKNAQNAGAAAVLVQNNVAGDAPGMGYWDDTLTIPVYSISQDLGTSIRNNLAGGVNVTMGDPTKLAGTTNGCVRLHASPDISSLKAQSHFSPDASPDLLMRFHSSTNYYLVNRFDLSLELLKDIGWKTRGDRLYYDGFEDNPCMENY